MKTALVYLILCLMSPVFLLAQESKLPENGIPVKFGKNFLFLSSSTNKAEGSTNLFFNLYDEGFNKLQEIKLNVPDVTAKSAVISAIYDEVPGKEWFEVFLKTSFFDNVYLRLSHDFKILARNETKGKDALYPFEEGKLVNPEFKRLPLTITMGEAPGRDQLNARTPEGGEIYLNSGTLGPLAQNKNEINSLPAELYYFEPFGNGFKVKWTLKLEDKYVNAYKIYLSGTDLFLYTSYYLSGDIKDQRTEQKIRKVSLTDGLLQYSTTIEKRDNFDFMLSGTFYDNALKELVICGNYMTKYSDKEQSKTTEKLSCIFLGIIDSIGHCRSKIQNAPECKLEYVDSKMTRFPFFCVKKLIKLRSGDYLAAGTLNYKTPVGMYNYQSTGSSSTNMPQENSTKLTFFPGGIISILFSENLEKTNIETDFFSYKKNPSIPIQDNCPRIEIYILGTPETDLRSQEVMHWNPETEHLLIIQGVLNASMPEKTYSIYAFQIAGGTKEYFKVIWAFPYSDNVFPFPIMAEEKMLICMTGTQFGYSYSKFTF